MSNARRLSPFDTTARLVLSPVMPDDAAPLFALMGDPRTWRHAPEGRHTDVAETRTWAERAHARWLSDGLSYWTARLRAPLESVGAAGLTVGVGGVQRQRTGAWNLSYRFAPAAWGRGLATELGRAALDAAARFDPHVAVIAWIDPGNVASARLAERLGLLPRGEALDPSDGVRRLAFTDRPLNLSG